MKTVVYIQINEDWSVDNWDLQKYVVCLKADSVGQYSSGPFSGAVKLTFFQDVCKHVR